MDDNRRVVPCPVCRGTGMSLSGTHACLCCKREGGISRTRRDILKKIGGDLRRRMVAKGIEPPYEESE